MSKPGGHGSATFGASNVTMLQLAVLGKEVTGASSDLVYEPLPKGDPTQRRPDITRARELLGWEPTIPLRDGLRRMHQWYVEELARG